MYGYFEKPEIKRQPRLSELEIFNLLQTYRVSGVSDGKESACNAGDPSSIPESGRSPGEGNGNPLQYYCLEYPMDTGTWGVSSIGSQEVGHD